MLDRMGQRKHVRHLDILLGGVESLEPLVSSGLLGCRQADSAMPDGS